MDMISAPLALSLAGVRLTGYVIETNLKMAQTFSRAAFEAQLYLSGVRYWGPTMADIPVPKPETKKRRAAATPKTSAKPKAVAKAKAGTATASDAKSSRKKAKVAPQPKPVAKVKPASETTARKAVSGTAKAAPKRVTQSDNVTAFPTAVSDTPAQGAKRPRKPSAPPAMPERATDAK